MTNADYILIIVAAFLGSLGSGFCGFLKSQERFDMRKFMSSVWSAILSAMLFASVAEKTSELGVYNFVAAFLGGAGVDVLTNRSQKRDNLTPEQRRTLEEILQEAVSKRTDGPGGNH